MDTRVVKIDRKRPGEKGLKEAAEVLRSGGVVVFPTDTVYGLAASAFNVKAQKKIYSLKGRSFHKPLILMASDTGSIALMADIPGKAWKIIDKFWPGPLTLVFHTTLYGKVVMGGRKDVGVRIPDDNVVLQLLKHCDFPIVTTSANPSSKQSALTSNEALKYFKDKVDLVIDSGPCPRGKESTVVDMLHFPFVVLREGCLPSKKLLKYI